ncbi:hypothetical protein D5S18_34060 [Nocardia panacis]|uniref:Secreted protein n=1 Tax=Nocardia panacis TaxID=2340916 RepID=A0A3A4JJ27_9NOCA|nr:hypothetical protein [Nocardia panacis]RJO68427.1 hypothetical protein D5S18_34060 [Nocardia panacis]
MSISFARVLSCGFASAAALFVLAPAAFAEPAEWEVPKACSGNLPTSDGAANVESCLYVYDGALRAYGSLTSKTGSSTIDNCTMVVTIIDKDAYAGGASDEVVATSGSMPCFNGNYPSPPLTVEKGKVQAGHRYVSFAEVTHDNQGVARIYSPELKP